MSAPTYLPFTIIAGCIATIVAVVYGVSRALERARWSNRDRTRTVLVTAVLLSGWLACAVALATLGVYGGGTSRIPTIQFGIGVPVLIGGLLIWRWPAVSRLIEAVPRHWIIAIQFFRVEGVTFLSLFAAGLLPGLFALPAGLGDVAVGVLAAAIAIRASGGRPLNPRTVLRWNVLGIADLVVAIGTGFFTVPSAFQLAAFDRPNELISIFPLVLIPTFLVPLAILLHVISLIQLRRSTAHAGLARERAAGQVQGQSYN
jgi:hypothetical protein